MSDRRRNIFILALVAGLLAASLAVIVTQKTRLGLDLKGGVSLVYEAKPTKQTKVTAEAIDRALDIMRERVDQLGVAEPEIQRSGPNQIDVSLPDVKNAKEAESQVGTVAQLAFYDWEKNVIGPDGAPAPDDPAVTGGPAAGSGQGALGRYDAILRAMKFKGAPEPDDTHNGQFFGVDEKTESVLCGPQETERDVREECTDKKRTASKVLEIPAGVVLVRAEKPESLPADAQYDRWYVMQDDPALKGPDIRNPEQGFDSGPGGTGQPNVTFDFTSKGKDIWQDVTREIAERGQSSFFGGDPRSAYQHFAIVLDNELISVPYIDFQRNPDGIDGSNGSEISGGFTIKSAQRLSNLLKTGALPLKLELISQSQVSATLGRQALNQGLVAGTVGFGVVALFLLAFYRVLGMIAVGALVVYGLYFFALIKLIPITLTLPGIAGLILTIGVAADANIVIFERIKEEIRGGRSVAAGIAQGYKRGIAAIIDANVVTFMVAFILFILATAGVKGFAFVLGIGTITSLFTAVLATQAVLGTMGRSRMISHPTALGAGETRLRARFDFMGKSKWFFSMSGVILLIGALAVSGKGLTFGIDFESGTRIKTALVKPANESAVRDVLGAQGLADAKIQKITDAELGSNAFQISTEKIPPDKVTNVTEALDQRFGIRGEPNSDSIGPTFGNTVAKSAVVAIIVSLLVVSAYIALRFEWKYAVPVVIALMHDLLLTGGVYSLTGREVTTSTVAALLTLLGFSLYDTIIVFDRIRENVPRMPRAAFSQIVNRSMSEVLIRSIATSFSTALPIFGLLMFGGETLKDFAFALLVGTLSGTYSSIFIAGPVLTHWKEREPVYRRRRERIAAENDGVVPAYAVGSASVEVALKETQRRRGRLTEPETPDRAVSKSEFDAMVKDLHVDPVPAPTATRERDPAADADPEDLVLKDDKPKREKQRRPRNKRHGRAR
jgi:SecD/SecF fusion protein